MLFVASHKSFNKCFEFGESLGFGFHLGQCCKGFGKAAVNLLLGFTLHVVAVEDGECARNLLLGTQRLVAGDCSQFCLLLGCCGIKCS